MKKIFVYTENYSMGGGNRYLVEFLNSIPSNLEVVLASNNNGVFNIDFNNIRRQYTYESLNVWTMPLLRNKLSINKKAGSKLNVIRLFLFYLLSFFFVPVFKCHNKIIFRKILNRINPLVVLSFSGGYPTALSCLDLVLTSSKLKISTALSVVSIPRNIVFGEKLIYGKVGMSVDSVIVNSRLIKEHLVSMRGFDKNKIIVINNCVNVKDEKTASENKFLDKLNISKRGNEIFFGYTGRIEKEKGVYVLLEAFIEVVKTFNNFRLFLVGAGNESNYINSIIKKKGLYGRIILCGFYEGDIYDALSAFDVFVFPSLWEGVPYAILDSMNAGNIIISTNVGGIPEVITDGVDGFLIPPCNVEELVNCMKRVGCNLENYRLMGDNSKEKIKTKYSSKVFRKNVEYVMVSLINL